jgi:protein-S-isoprenylcysteine O-methyltransferase Ste14
VANLRNWIFGAWLAGLAFWALASIASKRTVRTQSQASELGQGALAGSGFVLLFNRQVPLGARHWRIVPNLAAFAYVGLALTIAGLGFMAWSRVALGRNWSVSVTIKKDHALVCSGPYAIVRHPLYAGVLLAMLGTAIFFGQIRGFMAVCLTFGGWWLKSRTEEEFMVDQFWHLMPPVSGTSEGPDPLRALDAKGGRPAASPFCWFSRELLVSGGNHDTRHSAGR